MSFILTLDTNALDKLFAEEDGSRLILRQAVIAELVKRVFPNNVSPDVRKEILAQLDALRPKIMEIVRDEKTVNRAVDDAVRNMKDKLRGEVKFGQTSNEMLGLVDARIDRLIKDRIEERAGGMQQLVDRAVDAVAERIEKNMPRWIDERVNTRIQEGIDAAIEKMRSAL